MAQNSAGTTYGYDYTLSTSAGSTPVGAGAPLNTVAPAVTGTPQRLAMLTATAGQWSPAAATYAYQWQRCPSAGGSCTDITAATGSSYTPQAADEGAMLQVQVTAANDSGRQSATSADAGPVSANPPVADAPPTIAATGTTVGSQLAASPGTWSPADVTYGFQWQDCVAGTCTSIAGATGATYTIEQADSSRQILVVVSATNIDGTVSASSTAVTVPASGPAQQSPQILIAPALSGAARRLSYLSVTQGTWTGGPTAFTYRWLRCGAATSSCQPIAGQTTSQYALSRADVGSEIEAQVQASNAAGATVASTGASAVIAPYLPVLSSPPSLTGTAAQGGWLTFRPALWQVMADATLSTQWLRCSAAGGACAPITGATGPRYQLTAHDVGSPIEVTQTATDPDGSVSATSAASGDVLPNAPAVHTLPRLTSGRARIGETLSATRGSWLGSVTSITDQFVRCSSTCVPVGAPGLSYKLVAADAGAVIRVRETAAGPGGSTSAYSAADSGPVRSGGAATAVSARSARPARKGSARKPATRRMTVAPRARAH